MKNRTYKYYNLSEHPLIIEIMENDKFCELTEYRHHGAISNQDHVIKVAGISEKLAKKFNADPLLCVRAALLHDFFFYDWRTGGPRLHGFRHPALALENAEEIFDLSFSEKDAILRHMWPLTIVPPATKVGWILTTADKIATWQDYALSLRVTIKNVQNLFRRADIPID